VTGQHFLIVHPEPEDGMDLEHPESCPQHGQLETVYGDYGQYRCAVLAHVEHDGFSSYFRRHPMPMGVGDDTEYVTPGRHVVEAWFDRIDCPSYGSVEYRTGLRLVPPDGGGES
jgi:hypothetical protein